MKIIKIPSLSLYTNTIAFYHKHIEQTPLDNDIQNFKDYNSKIINEIQEITLMMEQNTKLGDKPTTLYYMKPLQDIICDITEDYEKDKDPTHLEDYFNHINDTNTNEYDTHDFRNTPNQYHISKYKSDNYLYQFGIDFLLTSEDDKYTNTYYSSILLPFLIDKKDRFTPNTNLLNTIFSLKVYKIPKHIKLPKLDTYFSSREKDFVKFYKIPKTFVKEVLSHYNRKNTTKILSDAKLLELFGCCDKCNGKSRKKKKRGTAQAGMQNVGGGAGMSQLKKGGMVGGKKKAKAKKTGGAPHNRLY